MVNYFRLYLHAAMLNLLVRLSQEIADPPLAPADDVPKNQHSRPRGRSNYLNIIRINCHLWSRKKAILPNEAKL